MQGSYGEEEGPWSKFELLGGGNSRERRMIVSAGENKALARRVIEEMFNRGNLGVADELLAPDYVDHHILAKPQNKENLGFV